MVKRFAHAKTVQSCELTEAQINHLRRLIGWVRQEAGLAPDELAALGAAKIVGQPSPEGAVRLNQMMENSMAVPQYVRDAIKALDRVIETQPAVVINQHAVPPSHLPAPASDSLMKRLK
jgi:hypothetical protein